MTHYFQNTPMFPEHIPQYSSVACRAPCEKKPAGGTQQLSTTLYILFICPSLFQVDSQIAVLVQLP